MLFNVGYAFVTTFFLATGFLMFALPRKYVGLVNWYYSKRGSEKSASVQKFLRWYYRGSGLVLLLFGVLLFLQCVRLFHR